MWTRPASSHILGVKTLPTHPKAEDFVGNPWLGDHQPGHGCRGPPDVLGHLTQPSGQHCVCQLHLQVSLLQVVDPLLPAKLVNFTVGDAG